jgi:ATP-dependent protease ClpP protease subunit
VRAIAVLAYEVRDHYDDRVKKTAPTISIPTPFDASITEPASFDRARTVRYVGPVTRAMNERVLSLIEKQMDTDPNAPINLFVTSTGGPTGSAMSFYDTVKHIVRPNLVTIGSGDVDSSGILIFLSGERRYVTARTTLLLHPAGRMFGNQRYTTEEMEAMLAEDTLKDMQYASVLADNSRGRLSVPDVLALMHKHTILAPSDLIAYGLADEILA